MQANPLWPVETRFPQLKSDIRKDVLVVGGGIAGISSALHLRKAGYDVAVIERNEIGGPATGASSGVLYYGSGTNLAPAIKLFGEDTANLLWKETASVIEQIVSAGKGRELYCGIRTCGSVMVAKTEAEVTELEAECAAIRRVGLPARFLSPNEVREYYPIRGFLGGLAYDGVAQVHPSRLAAEVAKLAEIEIYESTSMTSWQEEDGGATVTTDGAVVKCQELILATNKEPCFGLESNFDVETSVILASKPTERTKDVFPQEKIVWSMEDRYDMIYPRGDRLLLELYALGDEADKMAYYLPGIDFEVDLRWGETWAKTRDWLPIVGRVSDHVCVATGMGDQGIVMGWLSGTRIQNIIEGKEDWFAKLASPKRFGISGSKERGETVAKERPQEMTSVGFVRVAMVSEVPSGKMKIVKVGGAEIVVANIDGSFYALPNTCTHAGGPIGKGKLKGSVVQCPFHGSKFDFKTGAVVSPPAELAEPVLEVKAENSVVWVRASP